MGLNIPSAEPKRGITGMRKSVGAWALDYPFGNQGGVLGRDFTKDKDRLLIWLC